MRQSITVLFILGLLLSTITMGQAQEEKEKNFYYMVIKEEVIPENNNQYLELQQKVVDLFKEHELNYTINNWNINQDYYHGIVLNSLADVENMHYDFASIISKDEAKFNEIFNEVNKCVRNKDMNIDRYRHDLSYFPVDTEPLCTWEDANFARIFLVKVKPGHKKEFEALVKEWRDVLIKRKDKRMTNVFESFISPDMDYYVFSTPTDKWSTLELYHEEIKDSLEKDTAAITAKVGEHIRGTEIMRSTLLKGLN